ncbi:MAG: hypothetical protein GKR98_12700 [Boseongicola sp.]|nr:MAG: hypothetical protein GKR98_12700 [Boseongicola sp.]
MKNLIATALVATLGFAGAASAMGDSRVDAAQDTLSTYGFNVDADSLSTAQVVALAFISVDSDLQPHTAESRTINKIRAILN